MTFRRAVPADLERIAEIYAEIHTEEETGRMSVGWNRVVYPTRQTAESAIGSGDMFVEERGGRIVAAARINQKQEPAYADVPWRYDVPPGEVMVLHTLVVSPYAGGKGCGTAFVRFYERYAMEHGCRCLRMDTNEKNTAARRLYQKLGYAEVAVVPCAFNGLPGVRLVCLEKRL